MSSVKVETSRRIVSAETLPGVRVIQLKPHADTRGRFIESYRQEWFPGRPTMVQNNRSDSVANVLRGLHYHLKQSDYWYVPAGRVFVALADLRVGSPQRGCVATLEIGDGSDLAVYIPPGVAHGYYAMVPSTMTYMVDQYYDTNDELGVTWDDPDLSIPWPFEGTPLLSPRDQKNSRVANLDPTRLPP